MKISVDKVTAIIGAGTVLVLVGALAPVHAQRTLQPAPQNRQVLANSMAVKTCPDSVRGAAFTTEDGGTILVPQGWFYQATIGDTATSTVLVCRYGLHSRSDLRASSPVYEINHAITGYKAAQCSVSGAILSCTR